ncbi:MAG: Holliday junction branch migration protein RuvA [Zoogloeaceae bacterium]|nr:Holliday junction branch migration protein RuvA [Zoogloeaceae bacterium]
MIGRLRGLLLEKNPPQILVDVGGVGYELDVPMSTFYPLPAAGELVTLHTHLAIREDGHFLYGFLTEAERSAFRQLIKVSGIGARTALALLSGLSVSDLAQAIQCQEAGRLVRVPGIGKKTAERLLLELKDKFGSPGRIGPLSTAPNLAAESDPRHDMLHALLALGYNDKEAQTALKAVPADTAVSEGIRLALRALSKA